MNLNRTFLIVVSCAVALNGMALKNPNRDPLDVEAMKAASLKPFCEFMKRRNPHIRNWKKGEVPTDVELKALIKRKPSLKKDLKRIRGAFYREIEEDESKRNSFRKKDRSRKTRLRLIR